MGDGRHCERTRSPHDDDHIAYGHSHSAYGNSAHDRATTPTGHAHERPATPTSGRKKRQTL
jgi:hypothetical protein